MKAIIDFDEDDTTVAESERLMSMPDATTQHEIDNELLDGCGACGDVGAVVPTPDSELPPIGSTDASGLVSYSLDWLGIVLRAAGLDVAETGGWKARGHGDFGLARGVLCHHTAGPLAGGNMPSLNALINGRGGAHPVSGPIANLGLGRNGTFYIVAAGRAYHAGEGNWRGVTNGNSSLIGIEPENTGLLDDPWPQVQLEAYSRGIAALLKHIVAGVDMCAGHKEYALPPGRKVDPDFDMKTFRAKVASFIT